MSSMTEAPVETAPRAPFARKWSTEKPYVPPVQGPVLVPARAALAVEVPSTAVLAGARLEALGWRVRFTYAQGHKLETETPLESVALRADHPDGRRAYALWELVPGEVDKKGSRKGSAKGGVIQTPPSRKGASRRGSTRTPHLGAEAWMGAMGYVPPPPKVKAPCPTCGGTHTKKAGCPIEAPMEHVPMVLEG